MPRTSSPPASCSTGQCRQTMLGTCSRSTAPALASSCCTSWHPTSAATCCWWTQIAWPTPQHSSSGVTPRPAATCSQDCRPHCARRWSRLSRTSCCRTTCTACPLPCTPSTLSWPPGTTLCPPLRTAMAQSTSARWRVKSTPSQARSGTLRSRLLSLVWRRCHTAWRQSASASTWPTCSLSRHEGPATSQRARRRSWRCWFTTPARSSLSALRC
ncbi:hypothetical protein HaLaN_06634, partial [Haematococcus lacustris]